MPARVYKWRYSSDACTTCRRTLITPDCRERRNIIPVIGSAPVNLSLTRNHRDVLTRGHTRIRSFHFYLHFRFYIAFINGINLFGETLFSLERAQNGGCNCHSRRSRFLQNCVINSDSAPMTIFPRGRWYSAGRIYARCDFLWHFNSAKGKKRHWYVAENPIHPAPWFTGRGVGSNYLALIVLWPIQSGAVIYSWVFVRGTSPKIIAARQSKRNIFPGRAIRLGLSTPVWVTSLRSGFESWEKPFAGPEELLRKVGFFSPYLSSFEKVKALFSGSGIFRGESWWMGLTTRGFWVLFSELLGFV